MSVEVDWAPKKGKLTNGPSCAVASIRLRNGTVLDPAPAVTAWTHIGSGNDIVAYTAAR